MAKQKDGHVRKERRAFLKDLGQIHHLVSEVEESISKMSSIISDAQPQYWMIPAYYSESDDWYENYQTRSIREIGNWEERGGLARALSPLIDNEIVVARLISSVPDCSCYGVTWGEMGARGCAVVRNDIALENASLVRLLRRRGAKLSKRQLDELPLLVRYAPCILSKTIVHKQASI